MGRPRNKNTKKRKPAYIPAASKASNEPKAPPFDTKRVPQEVWAAIFNYVGDEPMISLGDYRLVCHNFNSAINPLIWNSVALSISDFEPVISGEGALLYDQSPLKLHEIRTVEEIVEQVIAKENGCRMVPLLLGLVYAEYLVRGVKYNETIAENLRKPTRELMVQIDNAWGPNRKSDRKTAAKIGRLIKNFDRDYISYSTSLREWRLKHASHFVNRHIEDIRTISISISSDAPELNSPYSRSLVNMAVELAIAPGLNKVDINLREEDDGTFADTILKKFRGRQNVDFKFNISSREPEDTASLLEKLKPFDRLKRTTADLTIFGSGEGQINLAAFMSLRKLELRMSSIPSNWIKAMSACPNLTEIMFDVTSVAYDEFDGVLQLPDKIEKLKLLSGVGGLRSKTGTIIGRGVKVLDLGMCISLKATLNLPSLETLIVNHDSRFPMVSQLLDRRHKMGQIKALCYESKKTDQLVQLLNHFRPSESLYFIHEGTFMEDYLEENIMAFAPGGPGFDGLEHFYGDDDYFNSDDEYLDDEEDYFADYDESVEYDKFNLMHMANLWKCKWIPPQVAISFLYEYSKGWHSAVQHFASLPRVSQLYVDFDSGLNLLPRHFYGPYRLTDDWCKNYDSRLMSFIYVDKKIAKDRGVKRPPIVAKYFK
ncbi:hypothetical protein TRVA0_024S01574 [Trichomonascus vanleenenianus]|uniref:uncharacterized protein n=1 Tax=Trichomonascus vanleenenianus TaxID=2268995 RepID=UPI003ECA9A97